MGSPLADKKDEKDRIESRCGAKVKGWLPFPVLCHDKWSVLQIFYAAMVWSCKWLLGLHAEDLPQHQDSVSLLTCDKKNYSRPVEEGSDGQTLLFT